MNNFDAYQRLQRVENAFKLADKLAEQLGHDEELLAHYTRYLFIICSGYFETAVRTILSSYASSTATTTAGYVTWQLKRLRNPNVQQITQTISAFDPAWSDVFMQNIEGAPSDCLNSIVSNRNKIAHGENIDVSYNELQEYFRNAKKVIAVIDQRFHSPGPRR